MSQGLAQSERIFTIVGGGPTEGPGLTIPVGTPSSIACDATGNCFIAATDSNRVFRLTASGTLTLVAGTGSSGFTGDGGPATSASLASPYGVALDGSGNVFIAEKDNQRVRRVSASTGVITTVAGNGGSVFSGDGGPATSASLSYPSGVAVDGAGNVLIADLSNHRIRRVDASTGVITTVAGNGAQGFSGDGGPATGASLWFPYGVAVDGSGNLLIADSYNHRIRQVDAATGVINTVAGNGIGGFGGDGGPATGASFYYPSGVSVDGPGGLVIADTYNHRIRRVNAGTGVVTTVAGNGVRAYDGDGGPAIGASLAAPFGGAVDAAGNVVIGDTSNNRVRRVDVSSGVITTVAGNGETGFGGDGAPAIDATIAYPWSLAVDRIGNLLIGDSGNNRTRRVNTATGVITTVAGNGGDGFSGDGGPATNASLGSMGVAVDSAGNIFISDVSNNRIRRVNASTGVITTVAGNGTPGFGGDGGPAIGASLKLPYGVAVDGSDNLLIADSLNNRIRLVNATTGVITTVAGNGIPAFSGDGGAATSASLDVPYGVAVDGSRNLFVADAGNSRIRRVDASTGVITTVAGNGSPGFSGDGGPATGASLDSPYSVAVDRSGDVLIADTNNNRIRRVSASTGGITTVAGNGTPAFGGDGGLATSASLNRPFGVAVDHLGNLLIADRSNHRIRITRRPALFYTVTPCRSVDTRQADLGAPALAAGSDRAFGVAGGCGVPATAKAVSLNVTVTQPGAPGNLRLHPGGAAAPLASAMNYATGQTRANNAVVPLGTSGELGVQCDQAKGLVHLIVDVNGYFE